MLSAGTHVTMMLYIRLTSDVLLLLCPNTDTAAILYYDAMCDVTEWKGGS